MYLIHACICLHVSDFPILSSTKSIGLWVKLFGGEREALFLELLQLQDSFLSWFSENSSISYTLCAGEVSHQKNLAGPRLLNLPHIPNQDPLFINPHPTPSGTTQELKDSNTHNGCRSDQRFSSQSQIMEYKHLSGKCLGKLSPWHRELPFLESRG